MSLRTLTTAAVMAAATLSANQAVAGPNPYIGEIMMVGENFCPRGWAPLDGQLLPINQNQALFSLLGTIYGGDGRTTFALPEMRGRIPVHTGTGPGLPLARQGARGGQETQTLNINTMPAHNHVATSTVTSSALNASTTAASSTTAQGNALGTTASPSYVRGGTPNVAMAPGSVTATVDTTILNNGAQQPFSIQQPYLTINFCIALTGVFPSRN